MQAFDRSIITFVLSLATAVSLAQAQPKSGPWLTSKEVAPGVIRIEDHGSDNMYLVLGKSKALLVDTGLGVGRLAAFVKTLTALPVVVVNTHGHPDHAGGNNEFRTVHAHPAEFDAIRMFGTKEARQNTIARMTQGDPGRRHDVGRRRRAPARGRARPRRGRPRLRPRRPQARGHRAAGPHAGRDRRARRRPTHRLHGGQRQPPGLALPAELPSPRGLRRQPEEAAVAQWRVRHAAARPRRARCRRPSSQTRSPASGRSSTAPARTSPTSRSPATVASASAPMPRSRSTRRTCASRSRTATPTSAIAAS